MGFDAPTFGFNEPTLTVVSYVSYVVAFLFFCAHLMTRSGRALYVPKSRMALAGAGAGSGSSGTVDMEVTGGGQGSGGGRGGVSYSPALGTLATGFVVLAWLSLTTALGMRWVAAGHPPYVTLYEIATVLVWGMTTIYLVLFEAILRTKAVGAFLMVIIFCLQSFAVWFIPMDLKRTVELVPALRSYWLLIHVSMAVISYSAFAVAAGAGLTFIAKHYLKNRLTAGLPSEAAIEEFMFRAVAVGFPFVTLVLITGAIWAQEAWTKAWSWDPKEVWALITWLSYAAYLHVRVQRNVRNITMAWLSLIGFGVVLFTFMGVNYLVQWFGLTSMHTYSVDNGSPPGMGVVGIGTVVLFIVLLAVAFFSWLKIKFPKRRRKQGSGQEAG